MLEPSSLLARPEILTFFLSMLPISELRGGLPFALSQGLSPLKAYLISVAGNILPVFPLLLLLRRLFIFFGRYKITEKTLNWTLARARKREDLVRRYGFGGLILLVAIPLPVTGAWTGTLVSFLLSMKIRHSFLAICIGVGIAGIIVLGLSLGGIGLWGLMRS
ncbi:ligand-binding protein SH3 [Candidatus Aerophobetes bacterium]|uniref:Ligand-binding protein SH3 n=1 Tax=Aerophobetes bacterium TaxID=2030807 RepID=A0A523YLS9_UNCAE|nr:MAG: ligand-binding protein SH3 [Candidatus Aerophobetes bacterium]